MLKDPRGQLLPALVIGGLAGAGSSLAAYYASQKLTNQKPTTGGTYTNIITPYIEIYRNAPPELPKGVHFSC